MLPSREVAFAAPPCLEILISLGEKGLRNLMAGNRDHSPKIWLGVVAFIQKKRREIELCEAKTKKGIGIWGWGRWI